MVLSSCGILGPDDFVDFDDFTVLPKLADLDFSNVNMKEGIVYWQLRGTHFYEFVGISLSGGVVARDDLDPTALAALDSTSSVSGFGPSCLPDICFSYIATVDESGGVGVWGNPQRVRELFTPTESVAGAALHARANNYHWTGELETSAYRTVPSGFELVVLKLGTDCAALQVLLGFTSEGDVYKLRQRVFAGDGHTCT